MGNLLRQSAPFEERIAGLLGLPSERRLNQLLEAVAVVCGPGWGPLFQKKRT